MELAANCQYSQPTRSFRADTFSCTPLWYPVRVSLAVPWGSTPSVASGVAETYNSSFGRYAVSRLNSIKSFGFSEMMHGGKAEGGLPKAHRPCQANVPEQPVLFQFGLPGLGRIAHRGQSLDRSYFQFCKEAQTSPTAGSAFVWFGDGCSCVMSFTRSGSECCSLPFSRQCSIWRGRRCWLTMTVHFTG